MKKFTKYWRIKLLQDWTSTLQTIDAGKYPHVTLRSAIASERINQLAVVCSRLLFAMMKMTQLLPTRPKRVTNQPTIQNQWTDIACYINCKRPLTYVQHKMWVDFIWSLLGDWLLKLWMLALSKSRQICYDHSMRSCSREAIILIWSLGSYRQFKSKWLSS